MTPLAHRILKELTLPLKRRTFDDKCGLLSRMADVHCFECSDVIEVAKELGDYALRGKMDERMTFLPAPNTWIEFREGNERVGLLLQQGKSQFARVRCALVDQSYDIGMLVMGAIDRPYGLCLNDRRFDAVIYGLLAIINTPRIIGRTTHMPHAGLQKRLATARGFGAGKFPLRAWTEIKLKVGLPKIESADQEIWLNGTRALHFVRAHLRIRLGRLEFVSSHWRGDPALGIKQTRYRLVA